MGKKKEIPALMLSALFTALKNDLERKKEITISK